MHGSSSELLLDRPRKAPEPPPPPAPVRTCMERLKFYVTSAMAMTVSGGFAALLFLVPLYVDPAVSTLMSDFDPEPVTCETSQVEYLAGIGNCTWSSCREGCTSDLYKCTHVSVVYTPNQNFSDERRVEATLLVNIKGCGYPPEVQCSRFWELYAREGAKFDCHYSRKNASLVMPSYDREEHIDTILHYFLVPFAVTSIASVCLCVLHCDCRCSRKSTAPLKRPHNKLPTNPRFVYMKR
ncbi:protein tipE isoform X2 [Neocloeon triangulifer]|uniref:protein tipE isoform X2 n=1 Tax=Neocloeon triangulifer TaxID=2078957 RepID=UPI00286EB52E|nr:protein tipE isoform X2 [Neocloeon triangulifer]